MHSCVYVVFLSSVHAHVNFSLRVTAPMHICGVSGHRSRFQSHLPTGQIQTALSRDSGGKAVIPSLPQIAPLQAMQQNLIGHVELT